MRARRLVSTSDTHTRVVVGHVAVRITRAERDLHVRLRRVRLDRALRDLVDEDAAAELSVIALDDDRSIRTQAESLGVSGRLRAVHRRRCRARRTRRIPVLHCWALRQGIKATDCRFQSEPSSTVSRCDLIAAAQRTYPSRFWCSLSSRKSSTRSLPA